MLLLAYLVTRDNDWDDATIRVFATNYPNDSKEHREELKEIISESRIHAELLIVPDANWNNVVELSSGSSLTFLPFRVKDGQPVDMSGEPLEENLAAIGLAALVQAGQPVDLDAEPEEGEAGNLAVALDTLEAANKRVEKARKDAESAAQKAEQAMAHIEPGSGVFNQETFKQLKIALLARQKAETARKKAVREEAKSKAAAELVKTQVDGETDNGDQ